MRGEASWMIVGKPIVELSILRAHYGAKPGDTYYYKHKQLIFVSGYQEDTAKSNYLLCIFLFVILSCVVRCLESAGMKFYKMLDNQ